MSFPVGVGATAAHRLAHSDGEIATIRGIELIQPVRIMCIYIYIYLHYCFLYILCPYIMKGVVMESYSKMKFHRVQRYSCQC